MLPQTKDPAIVELKSIVETKLAIPTTFMEATWNEANQKFDGLKEADFPVFLYLTQGKNRNKFNEAGLIKRRLKITGFLLNKIDQAAIESLSSEDLNSLKNQMRQLAENLMYWINLSPLSISEDGGVNEWDSDSVMEQGDANLYGQAVVFDWSIVTATNGYYNNPG